MESEILKDLDQRAKQFLLDDAKFRIQLIIMSMKLFARNCGRAKLLIADAENSLKIHNVPPEIYVSSHGLPSCPPFSMTSGGRNLIGLKLSTSDDGNISLEDSFMHQSLMLHPEIAVQSHWLSIEGRQPSIRENMVPLSIELQREVVFAPQVLLSSVDWEENNDVQRRKHTLTLEQQVFFRCITEAIFGCSEKHRKAACESLHEDGGFGGIVSRFCYFISEGIRCNLSNYRWTELSRLLLMLQCILRNEKVSVQYYLSLLLPAVISCLVCKHNGSQVDSSSSGTYLDNFSGSCSEWQVQEQAAALLAEICTMYSDSLNVVQSRITQMIVRALHSNTHLVSVYGSLLGLLAFGPHIVRSLVLPSLCAIGERLQAVLTERSVSDGLKSTLSRVGKESTKSEKAAATRIKVLVMKHMSQILSAIEPLGLEQEAYVKEYGTYFGPMIFDAVCDRHGASMRTKSNEFSSFHSGIDDTLPANIFGTQGGIQSGFSDSEME